MLPRARDRNEDKPQARATLLKQLQFKTNSVSPPDQHVPEKAGTPDSVPPAAERAAFKGKGPLSPGSRTGARCKQCI